MARAAKKKPATPAAPENEPTITPELAARLLGTTEQEIFALSRKRQLPIIRDNKLPLAATIQRYVKIVRDDEVTKQEGGRTIGTSGQWVHQLVVDGYLKAQPGGGFRRIDVALAYIRYLKDDERRSTKSAADSRVRDARAREIEMRIAERQRELIPLEDAQAVISEVAALVKAELSGLPARYTRDITARRALEKEIDGTLARLSAKARTSDLALATGRIDLGAETEVQPGDMGSAEPDIPRNGRHPRPA